jgi:hypothetical protein
MFNFVQVQGQCRRKAALDGRQAARKGEGHGGPESTRRFQPEEHVWYFEDSADASLSAKSESDAGT